MCGRYTLTLPWAAIGEQFGVGVPGADEPRYNAAPGQAHPVITCTEPEKLQLMHWGFPVHWGQKSQLIINARKDSLSQKALFREKVASGRCLIPADSFYEWEKKAGKRVPVRFLLKDKGLFAFAGLFGEFKTGDNQSVVAFTIITTAANELVKPLHDRMPLMLPPARAMQWLEPDEPDGPGEAIHQLQPIGAHEMTSYPVSPKVNHAANNYPELIKPWTDPGLTLF